MTSTLIFNGIAATVAVLSVSEVHQASRFLKRVRDEFVLAGRAESRWEGRVLQCHARDKAKEVGFAPSRYYTMHTECLVLAQWPIVSQSFRTFR